MTDGQAILKLKIWFTNRLSHSHNLHRPTIIRRKQITFTGFKVDRLSEVATKKYVNVQNAIADVHLAQPHKFAGVIRLAQQRYRSKNYRNFIFGAHKLGR